MSAIDAVLVKIRQIDGPDIERWCRRIVRFHSGAGTTDGWHLYAYSDVRDGYHYPPGRCVEIRDGRVEVRVVEVKE